MQSCITRAVECVGLLKPKSRSSGRRPSRTHHHSDMFQLTVQVAAGPVLREAGRLGAGGRGDRGHAGPGTDLAEAAQERSPRGAPDAAVRPLRGPDGVPTPGAIVAAAQRRRSQPGGGRPEQHRALGHRAMLAPATMRPGLGCGCWQGSTESVCQALVQEEGPSRVGGTNAV